MITFDFEDINPIELQTDILTNWIEKVAKAENKCIGTINYLFCNDNKILETNLEFLNHDYYTDIITFDYSKDYPEEDSIKSSKRDFEDCSEDNRENYSKYYSDKNSGESFGYNSKREKISGDILISLDTVKSNSEKYGTNFSDELHRVVIHGVLHLCGLNDQTEEERLIMRDAENSALILLESLK